MNHDSIFTGCVVAFLLLIVMNIWLTVRVLNPLQQLVAQVNQLSAGDMLAVQRPCGGISEVQTLQRSLISLVAHVRRSQKEHHAYTNALQNGQESERTRLAQELHDETVQNLIAIGQSIDIAVKLMDKEPSRSTAFLKSIRTQVSDSVMALRSVIADLRPPVLDELGLVSALHFVASKSNQVQVSIHVKGIERRLDSGRELALFRCVQEALNNTIKHSNAREFNAHIMYEQDHVCLSLYDDGDGFEPPADLDCFKGSNHFGLIGIRERVEHFEGEVRLTSRIHHGTQMDIRLPTNQSIVLSDIVRDPVCSAVLQSEQAYGHVNYQGETFYFCCPVCQGAFQNNPEPYIKQNHGKL